jgi:hypothetical protein
MFKHVGAMDVA